MFLDTESTGVDIESELSQRNSPARKLFPGTTNGIDEQLSHDIANRERWLLEVSNCSLLCRRTARTYRNPKNWLTAEKSMTKIVMRTQARTARNYQPGLTYDMGDKKLKPTVTR